MRGTYAQGRCIGKTGTLRDVASLAGYCHAADGHLIGFAILANALGNTYLGTSSRPTWPSPWPATPADPQGSSARSPGSSSTGTPSRSACASLEPGLSPATT